MSAKDNLIVGGIIAGFLIVVAVIFYLAFLIGHWLFGLVGLTISWLIIGTLIEFFVGLIILSILAIVFLFLIVELL